MKRKNQTYRVKYRRKREGRTNYKKRLKMLISHKPRLVIRKSLNNILASITDFSEKGDKVLISAHSKELENLGWKFNKGNLPSAYLTGLLLGKKALSKGIDKFVVDIGLNPSIKGSRLYAVISGVLDSGIKLKHSEDVLPSKERISGRHIEEYAKKIKDNKELYEKQFSYCIKNNVDPENIVNDFETVKGKITGGKE